MRAAIYTRVSLDRNATKRSVQQQEAECRQVCAENGWTVVDVFSDNDRSASRYATKDRPGYVQVKQFIDAGRADVLVMWEGSRATRDLGDFVGLRNLCEQRKVLYCYSGRVYDLSNADDRHAVSRDALDAERESAMISKRVNRAVRANMATGRPFGRLLYGYRRVYDGRGVFVEQVEHEDQAQVVREAGRRIMAGDSCRAVALDFNARGIAASSGGTWDPIQIRRMVTNPGYAGRKVHHGQVVGAGDWPALLDEKTYAACVARMSDPRRKTVRDASVRHLLSGAARCGVCSGYMRVQKNRGFQAYLCEDKFCVSMKTTGLEEYVTDELITELSQWTLADLMGPPSDDLVALAREEHAELTQRLNDIYEQGAAGKISGAGVGVMEAKLIPEIEDAARRASTVPVPQVLQELVGKGKVREVWEKLSIGLRREVIYLMMDIKIHPTIRGTRRLRPERVEITWKRRRAAN
jgi:site-specific DNA recombinase